MIERLAPGVFVTEVAFAAKTIEGVSTSTADLIGASRLDPLHPASNVGSPAWTETNQADPGVTLLELFSWVDASITYRTYRSFEHLVRHAAAGSGIASGLSVGSADGAAGLTVTPGQAVGPDGRPINAHAESARRVIDPDL